MAGKRNAHTPLPDLRVEDGEAPRGFVLARFSVGLGALGVMAMLGSVLSLLGGSDSAGPAMGLYAGALFSVLAILCGLAALLRAPPPGADPSIEGAEDDVNIAVRRAAKIGALLGVVAIVGLPLGYAIVIQIAPEGVEPAGRTELVARELR